MGNHPVYAGILGFDLLHFFCPPSTQHISLRSTCSSHRSDQRSTTIMIAPWLSAISSHFILRFLRPARDDWNHCASDIWNLLNFKPTWKKTCVCDRKIINFISGHCFTDVVLGVLEVAVNYTHRLAVEHPRWNNTSHVMGPRSENHRDGKVMINDWILGYHIYIQTHPMKYHSITVYGSGVPLPSGNLT